jgi:2-oxoglutarate dehydrogenase E2 component (dihydrolipoamide succinyltransferase)
MQKEVVMPQMGESVAEGTVTTWFKDIGDYVERDEALLEITTDKVDSEVASPSEGVLVEKLAEPGETVEVNTVIAVVDTEAEEGEAPDLEIDVDEKKQADEAATDAAATDAAGGEAADESDRPAASDESEATTSTAAAGASGPVERSSSGPSARSQADGNGQFPSKDKLRRTRSTPLVRRIADEHGIDDLTQIEGSGLSGRVTKEDIQAYIDAGKHLEERTETADDIGAQSRGREPADRDIERPDVEIGERDRVEAMDPQRQMIAEHMVRSRATSAHAQTIHEVDFSRVVEDRNQRKEAFADRGVDLTYTAYLVKAATEALLEYPLVNATVDKDEENIIYRGDINVGMAVAIEKSLIVPVIDNADELSLLGIARRVNDLAERARNKQLDNDEVKGGTFTVSNHGVFGPEFGIPIINQPQAAILSTGAIKKRVTVDQETEAIEVRPTSMWCMSFDHRIIDGATADKFMRRMRNAIENWDH